MSLPNQQPRYQSTTSKLRKLAIPSSFLLLFGCNTTSVTGESNALETVNSDCIGKVEQHTGLVPLPAEKLPSGVVMPQQQGGLCKGQVFVTTQEITIWRAWNSEYTGSKLGKWWTFDKPRGSISQYRRDNVICPSYSPLDMLVSCKVKVGTQVVVGPGQSAKCSDYFSYPASKTNQIYLADAENTTLVCQSYDGRFSWREAPQKVVKSAESL
ncbi:hypothetical protein [Pseudoalteromonas luteoviolacea]|uniref:Uncharacterized protein n=1 Tax=Pseudoalteromonas luteoviolacea H33 TaxID=1365251 RepID=A0A161Y9N3_9GAMM|nr:hypothetical protein [Pseudoalteromonas luteoviolacea]KZN52994.1 hypothetical protein N476_09420 [Pseudoalteromonas luteoviolacea H33]KZN78089.1 hypothetical protein N477_10645 [Pseudoalteromonas luteoviolacea H33-S]